MMFLLTSLALALSVAPDADGDGFSASTDCDDSNASVYPGASEYCDGLDNDCDGVVPSEEIDGDGDGYVVCTIAGVDCGDHVAHDAANATWDSSWGLMVKGVSVDANGTSIWGGCDCNDDPTDPNAVQQAPALVEECEALSQVDTDCDGDPSTNNGVAVSGAHVYYLDADGDGFGTSTGARAFCDSPEGYAANDVDCDDSDSSVSPVADEVCNGKDDDCDGAVDNDDYLDLGIDSGCVTLFADVDADDWPGPDWACLCLEEGESQVSLGAVSYLPETEVLDCDDNNGTVYPGAPEALTGLDEDCDGWVAVAEADCDDDGYRAVEPSDTCSTDEVVTCWGGESFSAVCDGGSGLLFIALGERTDSENDLDDCDDLDSSVHPGASDVGGDGVDQDCDGADAEIGETGETGLGDTGPGAEKGCDCSTSGGSLAGLWLMGLVGLFWRRRR